MQINTPNLFVEINETSYTFAACIYDESHNLKIIERIIVSNKANNNNKFTNISEAQEVIKENVKTIEKKLNCFFEEATIIIDSFDCSSINISGFKKLNSSQVLKENISYILNSLKLTVTENEKGKTILHIFNSKSFLDGNYVQDLPIGLFGDFYSHELSFFLIGNNELKNIKQIFNKNNINVKKVLAKNFIEGAQIINQNNDTETFFQIKIKKNSSSISFFDQSSLKYVEYFNFGTNIIFKDITKVCSIDKKIVEKILLDKFYENKSFKENEFLEDKYFIQGSYRKIRKKLITDIANARIEEVTNIILNKNINIRSFKKENVKIYVIIGDKIISDNFKANFKSFFLQDYNFNCRFINDFEKDKDSIIMRAAHLSIYGWKKEAIPVTQTKNSLIARIFKSLFG